MNRTGTKKFTGFSGAILKYIAIASMCFDHIGAILLEGGLLPKINAAVLAGTSLDYLTTDYHFWYNVNFVFRFFLGRLAFPLYCFLLVEGFLHTRNIKKYTLRLGLFALISEIPFNLALYQTPFDYRMQNVYFTLFIGLLVLTCVRYLEEHHPQRTYLPYVIVLAGMFAAYLLQTDYSAFGILLITLLYFLRSSRNQQTVFGVICTLPQYTAPLSFLFIRLYNGERGKQLPKYFFYAFYPAHLLLLSILRCFLI